MLLNCCAVVSFLPVESLNSTNMWDGLSVACLLASRTKKKNSRGWGNSDLTAKHQQQGMTRRVLPSPHDGSQH
jgi:hypothetical protein